MKPLVSVIIPAYNAEKYLEEALDSVITQTYKKLDIIVINDGSTDNTCKICEAYQKKDERIKVIHQKNKGVSAARNIGLNIMRGDYVTFLDSDDAYVQDAIETLVNSITDSNADIVCCRMSRQFTLGKMKLSDKDIKFLNSKEITQNEALYKMAKGEIYETVWDKIYKRQLFDNNLRFIEGQFYEDSLIMPYIIEKAHKVVLIQRKLYLYRKNPRGITSKFTERKVVSWLYVKRDWLRYLLKNTPNRFSIEKRNELIDRHLHLLIGFYLNAISNIDSLGKETRQAFEKEIERTQKLAKIHSSSTKKILFIYNLNPIMRLFIWKIIGMGWNLYDKIKNKRI